jgi:hypothetical protein
VNGKDRTVVRIGDGPVSENTAVGVFLFWFIGLPLLCLFLFAWGG